MPDLDTSLSYCTYCPKLCRHVCPVSNATARETLVPQAKMTTLGLLRTHGLPLMSEHSEALYACTGCLACTNACHHGITPGKHLIAARAVLEHNDAAHPALDALPARLHTVSTRAIAQARRCERPPEAADAAVAFLPGCTAAELTGPALALFDRLGLGPVVLANVGQGCGGYPLWAGGFDHAFRLHAERLARELSRYREVIVACPACLVMMKEEYPRHGVALQPKVMHSVEFLAPHAERLRATIPGDGAYYHDPCYLGRHLGVYDAPRDLLRGVLSEVREFSRNRGESECSGGGGLLPLTAPETADAITAQRLIEVREQGPPRIITACGTCKRRLAQNNDNIQVQDIIEVLEEATR